MVNETPTAVALMPVGIRLQARGNHPMPAGVYTYHFEVKSALIHFNTKLVLPQYHSGEALILTRRCHRPTGIGCCRAVAVGEILTRMDNQSYGRHNLDGRKCNEGNGIAYGPLYSSRDVVGYGSNFRTYITFFTKNGGHPGE